MKGDFVFINSFDLFYNKWKLYSKYILNNDKHTYGFENFSVIAHSNTQY